MYVSGYEASPYGVEWLRFEPGSPLPELVKRVPHVAFVVDDLSAALAGRELLIEPNRPAEGHAFGSRIASERLGVPLATARLQPQFVVDNGSALTDGYGQAMATRKSLQVAARRPPLFV